VTLIALATAAVLLAFVGLDFWWKADKKWQDERAERLALDRQLKAFRAVPALFTPEQAAAALVVWKARTSPGAEILVAADTLDQLDRRMEEVEALIESGDVAPGRSSITHRPGMIRFANGSRILFRFSNGGIGFTGSRPAWTCWVGRGTAPEDLRVAARFAAAPTA
jgi:hypothetical protein